ncbi:MAG: aconitase family protein, partial [Rhodospirillaceae bacterium]|nr:aconitase family protein [Rhodospirillaceae bacterium]
MTRPRTMFDKIWDAHAVVRRDDGQVLLYIDRHYVIEGSFHAFDRLRLEGLPARRPRQTFGMADHYVPTRDRHMGIPDPEARAVVELFGRNTRGQGITAFDMDDPRQGIVHVVAPEQGLTLPGMTIVCGDSHTSTNGAFGTLAFGIGASEAAHVLATQTLWQRKPENMRITVTGALPFGITAKDVILAIIARIGTGGGTGHVIEYAGSAIAGLSMEQRMT